jgi:hypothetical protein
LSYDEAITRKEASDLAALAYVVRAAQWAEDEPFNEMIGSLTGGNGAEAPRRATDEPVEPAKTRAPAEDVRMWERI